MKAFLSKFDLYFIVRDILNHCIIDGQCINNEKVLRRIETAIFSGSINLPALFNHPKLQKYSEDFKSIAMIHFTDQYFLTKDIKYLHVFKNVTSLDLFNLDPLHYDHHHQFLTFLNKHNHGCLGLDKPIPDELIDKAIKFNYSKRGYHYPFDFNKNKGFFAEYSKAKDLNVASGYFHQYNDILINNHNILDYFYEKELLKKIKQEDLISEKRYKNYRAKESQYLGARPYQTPLGALSNKNNSFLKNMINNKFIQQLIIAIKDFQPTHINVNILIERHHLLYELIFGVDYSSFNESNINILDIILPILSQYEMNHELKKLLDSLEIRNEICFHDYFIRCCLSKNMDSTILQYMVIYKDELYSFINQLHLDDNEMELFLYKIESISKEPIEKLIAYHKSSQLLGVQLDGISPSNHFSNDLIVLEI